MTESSTTTASRAGWLDKLTTVRAREWITIWTVLLLISGQGFRYLMGLYLYSALVVLTIAGMLGLQYLPRDPAARLRESFGRLGPMLQGAVLALGLFVITTLGAQGVTPFIYFRF